MDEETTTTEKTVVTDTSPGGSTTKTTVTKRGFMSDFFVSKTNQIIFGIIAIIDVLLLLRILFLLLGANRVGIVTWLLGITDIFVAPFVGIFPSPSVEGSYLDVAAILAIIIWAVIGFIIGMVLEWFSSSTE